MDDVFQAAVDSLLELFGSDAKIISGKEKIDVRCSPMFSSKLENEKTGARVSSLSGNVIVAEKEEKLPQLVPEKDLLELKGETYRIQSVFKIDSSGPAIAYELGLRK